MRLALIGLNHKTAPVETRELVAVAPEEREEVRQAFATSALAGEVVVLSTCNRTEIYLAALGESCDEVKLAQVFEQVRRVEPMSLTPALYFKTDEQAVEHLFRVAAGLDAMIVGETQILGQMRDAYEDAKKSDATGPVLNKLFQSVTAAAKKSHAETRIAEGAVSVSYAAAELAKKIFADLSDTVALVIGAGDTGRLAACHLKEGGVSRFVVANRSPDKAAALAADVGGEAIALDAIAEHLGRVDIVIGCAQTRQPLVTHDMVKTAAGAGHRDAMFFIDLGMPRNFDDNIRKVANVFAYTLDDLAGVVAQNIERRKDEAVLAERILDAETAKFYEWERDQAAVPVIRDLQHAAELVRQREVTKHKKRFLEHEHDDLERLTKIIVKRILQAPILQLKEDVRKERPGVIAGVRELFRLGGKNEA